MREPDPTVRAAEGAHYKRPGWFARNVLNTLVARLTRMGVSLWGSRVLRVRGRASGQIRSKPVNVLTLNGARYLVAPRGQTDWVRNLRVAGAGELVVGRRVEPFTATEIGTTADSDAGVGVVVDAGADRLAISVLRAYLHRWKWEVGQFFDGVGPDSTDDELLAVAGKHPLFGIAALTR